MQMAMVTQTRAPVATLDVYAAPTLEGVVEQYSNYVATIGFRILGRRSELDDLLQEVFLEAHRTLGRLRDPLALRAWLATVTVRAARKMLRIRRMYETFLPMASMPAFEPADPSASAEERHLHGRVYRVLDRMPANQRIAWILKELEGESLDQIADACGCSIAAVKRRVGKAQDMLDEELFHE